LWPALGSILLNATYAGHDFFNPQTIKQPAAFILKNIIHNWGDSYSLKILKHLRAVASPHTKLFIIGAIIQYLCSSSESDSAEGPLLPSYGPRGEYQYELDMGVSHLSFFFFDLSILLTVHSAEDADLLQRPGTYCRFFDFSSANSWMEDGWNIRNQKGSTIDCGLSQSVRQLKACAAHAHIQIFVNGDSAALHYAYC
jgi:hypothetical protein